MEWYFQIVLGRWYITQVAVLAQSITIEPQVEEVSL